MYDVCALIGLFIPVHSVHRMRMLLFICFLVWSSCITIVASWPFVSDIFQTGKGLRWLLTGCLFELLNIAA